MSDSENREMASLRLLSLFLLFGALLLGFALATVHHRSAEELATVSTAKREQFTTTWWLQHGYFRSAGLLVFPGPHDVPQVYQSATGGYLVSGFVLEKLYAAITGHPSWRLLKLHNQLVSLLSSVLLALLAFRLARRFGMRPLHAFAVAAAFQAVYFTFPDNLLIYWEMTARGWWLPFVCLFLLADLEPPSRTTMIVQAVSAFFLTYMEYVAGLGFLASWLLIVLLSGERRASWKRLALVTAVPIILALGIFKGQLALAKALDPQLQTVGSEFSFRTGLDGSTQYYNGHLDIAYGRDLARRNFGTEKTRPLFFRWPWLFFASAAATIFIVIGAMRGRVPHDAVVALLSLLGAYLIYAAVFSQAVVIHPYYYDVMLFTPLMLALFVLTPSLIETMTREKGLTAIVAVFLALWVSMVQLRNYAILFPPPPPEKKVGHGGRTVPRVEQWTGVPLPQPPESAQEGRTLSL